MTPSLEVSPAKAKEAPGFLSISFLNILFLFHDFLTPFIIL